MLLERKQDVPFRFNRAASSYDLLTSLNPGYRAHLRMSAQRLEAPAHGRILDLCCGTGVSTEALVQTYPLARITGLDGSVNMLKAAKAKSTLRDVTFVLGDASDPARAGAEGPYDAILMAYGIRNIADVPKCLENLLALLKPGGTICFHEYSVKDSKLATLTFRAVCRSVIVPFGALTTGDAELYRYLEDSVCAFDGVRDFLKRLGQSGFVNPRVLPTNGWQKNIVHSFVAQKPAL